MKRVDSDALSEITAALGITGRGAQITEFMDGQLDQTLDVAPLVRRGRTISHQQGLFIAVLSNIHAAGDDRASTITPYSPGVANIPPWPDVVPNQFDIWLLTASVDRAAGAGGFTRGTLFVNFDSDQQGLGRDSAGSQVVRSNAHALARWDAIVTQGTSGTYGIQESGEPTASIGLRLPRGGVVLNWSSTSAAAATFDCQMVLGLFPNGLGQDVVV